MHRHEIVQVIREYKVVGIVRAPSLELGRQAVHALLASGLRVVELSLTTPGALQIIADVARLDVEGLVLGAGTVLD